VSKDFQEGTRVRANGLGYYYEGTTGTVIRAGITGVGVRLDSGEVQYHVNEAAWDIIADEGAA
jgi:hypothetical protein